MRIFGNKHERLTIYIPYIKQRRDFSRPHHWFHGAIGHTFYTYTYSLCHGQYFYSIIYADYPMGRATKVEVNTAHFCYTL